MTQTPEKVISLPSILDKPVNDIEKYLVNNDCNLLLDFINCNFITVDGIEWLEEILVRANSKSIKIMFANIQPDIYKVFKISRIEVILKVCGATQNFAPFC